MNNFELPEKLPPQNIEAEKSLLGSLMLDKDAIFKVVDFLTPEDFYKGIHREIYLAMIDLFERGEPIDLLSLSNRLKEKEKLEEIGGNSYLTELINCVPTASHIFNYAKIVQRKRILRDLISASQEIGLLGYNENEDIDSILDQAEKRIFSIAQKSLSQEFLPVKATLEEAFERIDKLSKKEGLARGLPTGFTDLDNILAGLQKSDLIILASRPSLGKCVSKDVEIVNPNPGAISTIEELVKNKKNDEVLTLNNNLKITKTKVCDFIDNGKKPVFKIKTALGREIETTITHPFLTIDGWKLLQRLKPGDRIAVPRRIPIFGKTNLPDYQIKLLAYFISEGDLTHQTPRFTNSNKYIVEDFIQSALLFPEIKVSKESKRHIYQISSSKKRSKVEIRALALKLKKYIKKSGLTQRKLSIKSGLSPSMISLIVNGISLPSLENLRKIIASLKLSSYQKKVLLNEYEKIIPKNRVTEWLKSLNLINKLSREKSIPEIVFTFNKKSLSLFLNRLFSSGGILEKDKKDKYFHLSYSSSSKKLAKQVQHLLLRFGILSKLQEKRVKTKNGIKLAYELEIHNLNSLLTFIKEIGIYGNERKLKKVEKKLSKIKPTWVQDTLPIEAWKKILELKREKNWHLIYQKLESPKTHNIRVFSPHPRGKRTKLVKLFHSRELKKILESDIYWDKIVSIKYVGEKQVYDLTIPNTHNFIANDFIVHNSSLALNIASNIAISEKIPVGIFSLEMSKDQLVDRLIAAQANIDLWRLRTGRLSNEGQDNDFFRIQQALGVLSEAPIYIDDAPSPNVLQMRAMSRRLQAKKGLGLIIIDYLQLVEPRNPNEPVVRQITEISRSLKALARELNVPVLAISQLSRAVEQRTPQIPRLADLRESGCLAGETLITRADTGERFQMKDLVSQKNIPIYTLDENGKIKKGKISKVFSSGEKMVYELRTRSGFKIKASANHPFRKVDGWYRLDQLSPGDRIATPRKLVPTTPKNELSKEEIILLAHLLGDGCVSFNQSIHYTSSDPRNVQIVSKLTRKLFQIKPQVIPQENWWHIYFPTPYPPTQGKHHPIVNWFFALGIKPTHTWKREIPQKIFSLNENSLRIFLKHLWSIDGNLSKKGVKKRKFSAGIYYSTTSEIMAEQIKHLLLRLGIKSKISENKKGNYRTYYWVIIQSKEDSLKFLQEIGSYDQKGKITSPLINCNVDIIPKESWQKTALIKEHYGLSWRNWTKEYRIPYHGSTLFKNGISKTMMTQIVNFMPALELKNFTESDIFWDEITSITPLGVEKVYDATVPGTHNFVANDIIVHNSLEQDADVVIFIYREDRYRPDTPRKNIADIIVAKHRNGPVGQVELYFDEKIVTFRNLEKEYQE